MLATASDPPDLGNQPPRTTPVRLQSRSPLLRPAPDHPHSRGPMLGRPPRRPTRATCRQDRARAGCTSGGRERAAEPAAVRLLRRCPEAPRAGPADPGAVDPATTTANLQAAFVRTLPAAGRRRPPLPRRNRRPRRFPSCDQRRPATPHPFAGHRRHRPGMPPAPAGPPITQPPAGRFGTTPSTTDRPAARRWARRPGAAAGRPRRRGWHCREQRAASCRPAGSTPSRVAQPQIPPPPAQAPWDQRHPSQDPAATAIIRTADAPTGLLPAVRANGSAATPRPTDPAPARPAVPTQPARPRPSRKRRTAMSSSARPRSPPRSNTPKPPPSRTQQTTIGPNGAKKWSSCGRSRPGTATRASTPS